jgi:hypothetical protein
MNERLTSAVIDQRKDGFWSNVVHGTIISWLGE